MRNTPKSDSLLRTQLDREEFEASQEGLDRGVSDEDFTGSGSRSRGTTMRTARADLSTHARGVENMNEALHPRQD
ncbi:hypothetical protein [Rhodococcus globerulus]|uniref:hypothetical protein n=1 Tax=Rhodococcus globerulus TaxID=33008 RepID=UPI000B082F30|nr:hypothetical protein [Rhodococcus globerulus]